MIYSTLQNLKQSFINHPLVNMSMVGSLIEYENISVKYPLVNIDVLTTSIKNDIENSTIRIHVLDRNKDPLVSYNKCQKIINDVLRNLSPRQKNYTVTYVVDEFNDMIAGCYSDIIIEDKLNGRCDYQELIGNYVITELGEQYVVTETGAYITVEKDYIGQDLFYFGSNNNIISEDSIKSLNGKSYETSFSILTDININKNIIAIPTNYSISLIEDENNMWANVTNEYLFNTELTIYNLNGVGINYNVYIQYNTYDREHKHNITIIKNE